MPDVAKTRTARLERVWDGIAKGLIRDTDYEVIVTSSLACHPFPLFKPDSRTRSNKFEINSFPRHLNLPVIFGK